MGQQKLFGGPAPLIAAPMAGGATTPALVRAAFDAGGFGFLAAGYKSAATLATERTAVADLGAGVNLFCPEATTIAGPEFERYADELAGEADRFGVTLDRRVRSGDDDWAAKLDLLLDDPAPWVSFTFGLPDSGDIAALQRVGTRVMITTTTVPEALAAQRAGADALIAQGSDAGGHSGTHDQQRVISEMPTERLVTDVVAATGLPTIAAGGVDGPTAVARSLAAGATAVMIGTLLLRTDESGASQTHRDALADPMFTETTITRAFTGRPARALRNAFIDRHQHTAPTGYPAIHHLTQPIRRAAARADDAQALHLWAGTGFRNAATGPAAAVLGGLLP